MSADGNSLLHGNKGHTGRQGTRNKRTIMLERIGEDNAMSLYNLHLETALGGEDPELRHSAQQFLLKPLLPNAKRGRRIEGIELVPILSIEDVSKNENLILDKITEGELTLEEGQMFFNLIEQSRKTREFIDIIPMLNEIKAYMKEHGLNINLPVLS